MQDPLFGVGFSGSFVDFPKGPRMSRPLLRQESYYNLLDAVAAEIDGFMGGSVVDLDTNTSLASLSNTANFDLNVASAYNAEMVKAKFKTINAMGLNSEMIDMVVNLTDQIHFIKLIDESRFAYVAVARGGSSVQEIRDLVTGGIREYI